MSLTTLAVANYRSLLQLVAPLAPLTVITGANGSGKSNLYRALRLLTETAHGGVINALARQGGLESTFWAGPAQLSPAMKSGHTPIQGTAKQPVKRVRLGFASEHLSYAISLGLPKPANSAFAFDPEIKRESIWIGPVYRLSSVLVEREGPMIKLRQGRQWQVVEQHAASYRSLFDYAIDPALAPEVWQLRQQLRDWRFYDHFRTDAEALLRQPQLGTRTPVLQHDGRDLAAALQTIREIGDHQALDEAIDDAFPGAQLEIIRSEYGLLSLQLCQPGLLRPLTAAELSDGTLRYLCLIAALLTPRPPSLMVLNEPETSLHPDLLPALARLIIAASSTSQLWVISHSAALVAALERAEESDVIALEKHLGETQILGLGPLEAPPWQWLDKG